MTSSPPKKEERGLGTTLKTTELKARYHALDLAQAPFGFVFWWIEQAKARLQDCIENERRRHA